MQFPLDCNLHVVQMGVHGVVHFRYGAKNLSTILELNGDGLVFKLLEELQQSRFGDWVWN